MAVSTTSELEWDIKEHYVPNPKQRLVHKLVMGPGPGVDEILYGGAKGGGKSYLCVFLTLCHCLRYGQDALVVIFRRTLEGLRNNIIREVQRAWPEEVGTYNKSEHAYDFHNGARVLFCALDQETSFDKHFGRQYTLICVDESTRVIPRPEDYFKLLGSLRSPKNPDIRPCIVLATNPKGPGHAWHKRRFVDPVEPMKRLRQSGMTRIFIPSKVYDNPYLNPESEKCVDGKYIAKLKSMPEADRKAYLEGSWEVFEGQAFAQWDPAIHLCDPFRVPEDWECVRCIDWGYIENPFHVGWLVKDPETETIYLADEWWGRREGPRGGLKGPEMSVKNVCRGIQDRESENGLPTPRVTVVDPSMWRRDDTNPSVADQFMRYGLQGIQRADNDRKYRFQLMHELLTINRDTGQPGFKVFRNSTGLKDVISDLQRPNHEDDVEKCLRDDPYDSVGYGLVEISPSKKRYDSPAEVEKIIQKYRNAAGAIGGTGGRARPI